MLIDIIIKGILSNAECAVCCVWGQTACLSQSGAGLVSQSPILGLQGQGALAGKQASRIGIDTGIYSHLLVSSSNRDLI